MVQRSGFGSIIVNDLICACFERCDQDKPEELEVPVDEDADAPAAADDGAELDEQGKV